MQAILHLQETAGLHGGDVPISARFGFRTITGKLLAAFLAVFLPLALSQYFIYHKYCETRASFARQHRAAAARAAAAAVDDDCEDTIEQLRLAYHILYSKGKQDTLESLFGAVGTHGRDCVAVGILNLKTNELRTYPPLDANQRTPLVPHPTLRDGPSVSSVTTMGGKRVYVVSTPIAADGDEPALISAAISAESLKNILTRSIGENSSAVVMDKDGGTICQTGKSIPSSQARILLSAPPGTPGTTLDLSDETDCPACVTLLSLAGWRVAVMDNGMLSSTSIGATGWFAPSMVLVVAFTTFFLIGRRIASPIRKLSRAAAAVAVGDFRRRVQIRTGDELESLAKSFNQMAASLEEHERELRVKTRVQQSLIEVIRTVTSTLDLSGVAASIADALRVQFGARQAIIFRRDDTSGKMEPVPLPDGKNDHVTASMLRLAEHTLKSPGALSLPAAVAYPCAETEGGMVVALPLVVGSKPVGVLTATFGPDGDWDPEMRDRMDLLESFASNAAIAVHNAEIHGQTEELMHMLSALRRVVNAISASLDLKQVLRSLVRITSEVMGAKSCALLLADKSGRLSVAEDYNLSKQYREKLNLAPGERWTGVVYAEKRAVSRADVAGERDLRLRRHAENEGLHGYIAAPLLVGDESIGAIVVWMDHVHEATPMEVHLLTSIASHAAMVIANAKLFGKEYQISETLQGTLIGSVPERLGRLAFGHKYLPVLDEAHVGGDLFDVIELPNGKVALVVADVSGKGIQAAVHTAMIRHTARAFLFQGPDSPAAALDLLNRALYGYLGGQVFVTVFCAVIDPETGRMVYANAGHPPAIALTRGGKQQVLFYRTGMPVGYADDIEYGEREVTLSPGDLLLIYTDGIIEAKQGGELLSLEGLQDILFRNARLGPRDLVETVCEETSKFSNGDLRDDIAIVAAALELHEPVA